MDKPVRLAAGPDIWTVAQMLHDFNTEFDEPTPEVDTLARRVSRLIELDADFLVIGGSSPTGLAVLRFREALWSATLECYLAELYVVPNQRGQGYGRLLMESAIELARDRGATSMDLGTSHDDVAARGLYESLGFRNTEKVSGGPVSYFYECDL